MLRSTRGAWLCALEDNKQTDEVRYAFIVLIWISSPFLFPVLMMLFVSLGITIPVTIKSPPHPRPCLFVVSPPNGVGKKAKSSPMFLLSDSLCQENQNKRWQRHTAPLMAALGSATDVSLNCLVHHFGFVQRDSGVVCAAAILVHPFCFYPQMDAPLVELLLLECIIPLTPRIIFKVFLLTCVCSATRIDLAFLLARPFYSLAITPAAPVSVLVASWRLHFEH